MRSQRATMVAAVVMLAIMLALLASGCGETPIDLTKFENAYLAMAAVDAGTKRDVTYGEFKTLLKPFAAEIALLDQANLAGKDRALFLTFQEVYQVYKDSRTAWEAANPGPTSLPSDLVKTLWSTNDRRLSELKLIMEPTGILDASTAATATTRRTVDRSTTTSANDPSTAASSTPTTTAYPIGRPGPAGGLVFFDKGNDKGGWRYLEAAPSEVRLVWGAYLLGTAGATATEVGSGQRNTATIEAFLQSPGVQETNAAVQYCYGLKLGGYYDWFLPTKDELALMYANLHDQGLGSFKPEYYWTSSEVDSVSAWSQSFFNGRQTKESKALPLWVRPIRAF